jgi:hypothetical protein
MSNFSNSDPASVIQSAVRVNRSECRWDKQNLREPRDAASSRRGIVSEAARV